MFVGGVFFLIEILFQMQNNLLQSEKISVTFITVSVYCLVLFRAIKLEQQICLSLCETLIDIT